MRQFSNNQSIVPVVLYPFPDNNVYAIGPKNRNPLTGDTFNPWVSALSAHGEGLTPFDLGRGRKITSVVEFKQTRVEGEWKWERINTLTTEGPVNFFWENELSVCTGKGTGSSWAQVRHLVSENSPKWVPCSFPQILMAGESAKVWMQKDLLGEQPMAAPFTDFVTGGEGRKVITVPFTSFEKPSEKELPRDPAKRQDFLTRFEFPEGLIPGETFTRLVLFLFPVIQDGKEIRPGGAASFEDLAKGAPNSISRDVTVHCADKTDERAQYVAKGSGGVYWVSPNGALEVDGDGKPASRVEYPVKVTRRWFAGKSGAEVSATPVDGAREVVIREVMPSPEKFLKESEVAGYQPRQERPGMTLAAPAEGDKAGNRKRRRGKRRDDQPKVAAAKANATPPSDNAKPQGEVESTGAEANATFPSDNAKPQGEVESTGAEANATFPSDNAKPQGEVESTGAEANAQDKGPPVDVATLATLMGATVVQPGDAKPKRPSKNAAKKARAKQAASGGGDAPPVAADATADATN